MGNGSTKIQDKVKSSESEDPKETPLAIKGPAPRIIDKFLQSSLRCTGRTWVSTLKIRGKTKITIDGIQDGWACRSLPTGHHNRD